MKKLLLFVAITGIALWMWNRPQRSPAPDQSLAKHFKGMCGVAKANLDNPRRGVDRLFGYFGEHTPSMAKHVGELLVEIERAGSDAAHDRRARKANQRLRQPIEACALTWQRFFTAVESDPVASAKLERGINRVARSLELIFGADAKGASWLPAPLARTLRR